MNYQELKNKHRQEFSDFPIAYAFTDGQFLDALETLGTTKDEVVAVGHGGIMRKSDSEAFGKLLNRLNKEFEGALKDKKLLTEAMRYELANHEYCITRDYEQALGALGLEFDKLNKTQKKCLQEARKAYIKDLGWE